RRSQADGQGSRAARSQAVAAQPLGPRGHGARGRARQRRAARRTARARGDAPCAAARGRRQGLQALCAPPLLGRVRSLRRLGVTSVKAETGGTVWTVGFTVEAKK